jgi:hypothetical protein
LRYAGVCIGIATVVDHVLALKLGGSDTDDNCQAACAAHVAPARPALRVTSPKATSPATTASSTSTTEVLGHPHLAVITHCGVRTDAAAAPFRRRADR